MRLAAAALAVFMALALQTTLAFTLSARGVALDLVLVVVIFVALVNGPTAGLLTGSVAGLAQDALAGGIVGVGGLAKSLVGFLSGVLGTQFIVTGAAHRFVVFFFGALLHAGVFLGLYQVIDPRGLGVAWRAVALQAAVNAAVGVGAFIVVERTPEWYQRRKLSRMSLRSRGGG